MENAFSALNISRHAMIVTLRILLKSLLCKTFLEELSREQNPLQCSLD